MPASITVRVAKGMLLPLALGGLFFAGSLSGSSAEKASAATPCSSRVLSYGARGGCVQQLQYALRRNSYYYVRVTGVFDRNTQDAVRTFQARSRLGGTSGTVNFATWMQLHSRGPVRNA